MYFRTKNLNFLYRGCAFKVPRVHFGGALQKRYSDDETKLILNVMNSAEIDSFSRYSVTKTRIKSFDEWRRKGNELKTLADMENIESFTERTSRRLFDSILEGGSDEDNGSAKIKGLILHPKLSEEARKNCKSALAVYITANATYWTLINRDNYEVVQWDYHKIDYREGKRMHITDIVDICWQIIHKLPPADVYVMKSEPTSLRATGSDPTNPKILTVNLQKAQVIAIIVALLNIRQSGLSDNNNLAASQRELSQNVYFIRPTLPYRLYNTLVGTELVSTEQTIESILRQTNDNSTKDKELRVLVRDNFKNKFRSQKGVEKDMMGHCLLLAMTFMDLCVYKNEEKLKCLTRSS